MDDRSRTSPRVAFEAGSIIATDKGLGLVLDVDFRHMEWATLLTVAIRANTHYVSPHIRRGRVYRAFDSPSEALNASLERE